MKRLLRDGDVVSGAVLTGLGIFIVLEARRWDYLAPDGPGPGFFPIWYGIALIALSVLLVVTALKNRVEAAPVGAKWGGAARALFAWAAFTASIALIKVLGFALSFALLTFFVVSIMYRRPFVHGVTAGVVASAAFYAVFPLALNVALPVGVLGF